MAKNTIRQTTLHGLTRAKAARRLAAIVREMKQAERKFSPMLDELHDHFKHSGINLIHYLVLRSNEIREIQEFLHHIGLGLFCFIK